MKEAQRLEAACRGEDYPVALEIMGELAELFAKDRGYRDGEVRHAVSFTVARWFDGAWANGVVVRSAFENARREWIKLEEVRRVNEGGFFKNPGEQPREEPEAGYKGGLPAVIGEEPKPKAEAEPGVLDPGAPLPNARAL